MCQTSCRARNAPLHQPEFYLCALRMQLSLCRLLRKLQNAMRKQDAGLATDLEAWTRRIQAESDAMLDFLSAHVAYREAEFNVQLLASNSPEFSVTGSALQLEGTARHPDRDVRVAAEKVLGQLPGQHELGVVPNTPRRTNVAARKQAAQEALGAARMARRTAADAVIEARRRNDGMWVTEVWHAACFDACLQFHLTLHAQRFSLA
jgi:hypothetical protein